MAPPTMQKPVNGSASTDPFRNLVRHSQYYIQSADLHFLIGNVQYKVHRYFFERESAFFRGTLALPASPGAVKVGSLEDPLVLEDVTPEAFEKLLWVFYNPRYSLYDAPVGDYISILVLAHKWGFAQVKAFAVRELQKSVLSDIDRIVVYHANEVDRNLLIPCFAALCAREHPLTLAEGLKLGMETTLVIASAREYVRAQKMADGSRTPITPTVKGEELENVIRDLFKIAAPTKEDASPSSGAAVNGAAPVSSSGSMKMLNSSGRTVRIPSSPLQPLRQPRQTVDIPPRPPTPPAKDSSPTETPATILPPRKNAVETVPVVVVEEVKEEGDEGSKLPNKQKKELKKAAAETVRRKAEEAELTKKKKEEEERRKVEEEKERRRAEEKAAAKKKAEEEEARKRAEEAEAIRVAEEAVKKRAEEAKRKAEEEAKRKAELAAAKKAEEEVKRKAEEEAKKKAEEAKKKAEEEAAKKKAEEEAQKKAEEEAKKKAEEVKKKALEEEEARRKAELEAQKKAEEEEARKRAEEEETKRKAEEEVKRKAMEEEVAKKKAEEEQRKREEEKKRKEEAEAKRKADEAEAKRKVEAEAEAKRKAEAEAEAKRKAEEEEVRRLAAEAEAKRKAEVEAEAKRKAEEEESRRLAEAEEEAQRKAAEEEAKRKQEEAKRKAEEEEQAKINEEEAKAEEEAAKLKAAEAEVRQKEEQAKAEEDEKKATEPVKEGGDSNESKLTKTQKKNRKNKKKKNATGKGEDDDKDGTEVGTPVQSKPMDLTNLDSSKPNVETPPATAVEQTPSSSVHAPTPVPSTLFETPPEPLTKDVKGTKKTSSQLRHPVQDSDLSDYQSAQSTPPTPTPEQQVARGAHPQHNLAQPQQAAWSQQRQQHPDVRPPSMQPYTRQSGPHQRNGNPGPPPSSTDRYDGTRASTPTPKSKPSFEERLAGATKGLLGTKSGPKSPPTNQPQKEGSGWGWF